MATKITVVIGAGNGLLPGGTTRMPVPVLSNYQQCFGRIITHTKCMYNTDFRNVCEVTLKDVG